MAKWCVEIVRKVYFQHMVASSTDSWFLCSFFRQKTTINNYLKVEKLTSNDLQLLSCVFLPLRMTMLFVFLDNDSTSKSRGWRGLNRSAEMPRANIGWVEAKLLELPFKPKNKQTSSLVIIMWSKSNLMYKQTDEHIVN